MIAVPSKGRKIDPFIRWATFVEITDSCWLWRARIDKGGYGRFKSFLGQSAHRFAFHIFNGPIPENLCIDHLCRNRACVNPNHLEAVTHLENVRRGLNHGGRRAIKCPHNVLGIRYCKQCKKDYDVGYYLSVRKLRRKGAL